MIINFQLIIQFQILLKIQRIHIMKVQNITYF